MIAILWQVCYSYHQNIIYLSKVSYGNIRTMYEICSKLTIETLNRPDITHFIMVSLLLTLNRFHSLLRFHCRLWTSKSRQGTSSFTSPVNFFQYKFIYTNAGEKFTFRFTLILGWVLVLYFMNTLELCQVPPRIIYQNIKWKQKQRNSFRSGYRVLGTCQRLEIFHGSRQTYLVSENVLIRTWNQTYRLWDITKFICPKRIHLLQTEQGQEVSIWWCSKKGCCINFRKF